MKKQKFVNLPRGGYRLGSGKDNFMNTVQVESPGRNSFDLSHAVKTTGRIAELIPVLCHQAVPGDKFDLSCDILARCAPMLAPIMDRLDVRAEYFFVPNRIVWPESGANQGWQKFIANETGITRPFITIDNTLTLDEERFLDNFRIPPFSDAAGTTATNVQAIPFACYQMIYRDYYRPQYLEAENTCILTDGSQAAIRGDLLTMRYRKYDNDYFTASLPNPQKGANGATIPGGVVTLDPDWGPSGSVPQFELIGGGNLTGAIGQNGGGPGTGIDIGVGPGNAPNAYNPDGSLLSGQISINDLREGNAIQKWLETFARVGSRYIELIKGFFNVRVEDYRLDRPEFITGVKAPVIISEVLQQSETNTTPQGNMGGHGISVIEGYQDGYFAKEHGYFMCILSVMPKATYCNGIERHWLYDSPNDWYWPQFANLGEQATMNQEICAYTTNPTGTFGYMPRYSELRTINDWVAHNFRPSTGNLEYWTVARDLNSAIPVPLNEDFLTVNEDDVTRIFSAAGTDDYFYFHVYHKIRANRPVPVYGTPQLI